jgi:hypothetical protein
MKSFKTLALGELSGTAPEPSCHGHFRIGPQRQDLDADEQHRAGSEKHREGALS